MSKGGIYDGPDGPLHGDGTAVGHPFGLKQWQCPCGTANLEIRRKCRSAGKRNSRLPWTRSDPKLPEQKRDCYGGRECGRFTPEEEV